MLKDLIKNKIFLVGLIIKFIIVGFFAGNIVINGFVPFIDYFASHPFSNPYNTFFDNGNIKAFPYSSVMLWIVGIFYFPFSFFNNTFLSLIGLKLPLLVFDFIILLILIKWFPLYKKKILYLYWLSPILIYISYFYGQFDVIPTALLFISLYLLFNGKILLFSILIGIGLATKTHLILALPFIYLYLYTKKYSIKYILISILITISVGIGLLLPYIFSEGYINMVLKNDEQLKIFNLFLDYGFNNIQFFVVPGFYFLIFLLFSSSKRMNQDYLMIFLGIIFSIMIIFVPPQIGWFWWSIPFMIYFFIKYRTYPKLIFVLFNIFYFLFFMNLVNGAFLPIIGNGNIDTNLYNLIQIGNPELIQNIFFTFLVISNISIAYWAYKVGIQSNKLYKSLISPFIIGVGGDSGSGKSTFVKNLGDIFNESIIGSIEGDDIHKWPRGHANWQKYTHLDPRSNNLHLDLKHAQLLKLGENIFRKHYDHSTGKFTEPKLYNPSSFIVFLGLHPFFLSQMRKIMDLKIFIKPDEDLRTHWKIIRDMNERGYTKEKVLEQMRARKDDSDKYIKPQGKFSDITITYYTKELIKNIGDPKEEITIYLKLEIDNSFYIENLIEEIIKIKTIEIEHYMSEDLEKQICDIKGTINSKQISFIVYALIPNYKDITEKKIELKEGYDGIIQLFVLYIIHEKLLSH